MSRRTVETILFGVLSFAMMYFVYWMFTSILTAGINSINSLTDTLTNSLTDLL